MWIRINNLIETRLVSVRQCADIFRHGSINPGSEKKNRTQRYNRASTGIHTRRDADEHPDDSARAWH